MHNTTLAATTLNSVAECISTKQIHNNQTNQIYELLHSISFIREY